MEAEEDKTEDITGRDDEELEQAFKFGNDRMVLPGVDLSCCEFPEPDNKPENPEVTACGIVVDDDESCDEPYEEF